MTSKLADSSGSTNRGPGQIEKSSVQCMKGGNSVAPLIICGPSGVGKGTLIEWMTTSYGKHVAFSVSHTTRAPRPGEIDGKSYHFTSAEAMEAAIARGEFLEHAKVHGNLYGTSFAAVASVASEDKICILDIDTQGVQSVHNSNRLGLSPRFIFIAPPSIDSLRERLLNRATETMEQINGRVRSAEAELLWAHQNKHLFDAIVVNGDLEEAKSELSAFVESWYPHLTAPSKLKKSFTRTQLRDLVRSWYSSGASTTAISSNH